MLKLYGIKNCDSCRNARKAFEAKGIDYEFCDLRADPPSRKQISDWLKKLDMALLLNKRGTTWRGLSDKDKAKTSKADLVALMAEHPTLLKRPICVGKKISVGWDKATQKLWL